MKTKPKKLANLGKGKSSAKKAQAPKKVTPKVTVVNDISDIARGYTEAEYEDWRATWEVVPGCPSNVVRGETSDGFHGVAIFYEDVKGELVSHVCYSSVAMRNAYAKALKYLYRQGRSDG